MPVPGGGHGLGGTPEGALGEFARMGEPDDLARHGAHAEALIGREIARLQPAIVEHERFLLPILQVQLAVVGTAQYISPEQARGETVDKRSDVYSSGCLLFELLTGRTPYTGEPISLTYQHVNADIPLPSSVNPDVPAELDAITHHALTKDRDERYPDARTMAEDLGAYRGGMPISPVATERLEAATTTLPVTAPSAAAPLAADPDTASMPLAGPRRRRSGLGWVFAALLLIPLALLGWYAWSASQSEEVVQVSVPDLVGKDEAVARADLTKAGLRPDVEKVADDAPVGEVVSQDPGTGASVPTGDTVVIEVSAGPDDVGVEADVPASEHFTRELQEHSLVRRTGGGIGHTCLRGRALVAVAK